MPQPFDKSLEESEDDSFLDDIDENDYVLIFDGSGELKTILMPENQTDFEVPDTVSKVLEVCGVNKFENRTLH